MSRIPIRLRLTATFALAIVAALGTLFTVSRILRKARSR